MKQMQMHLFDNNMEEVKAINKKFKKMDRKNKKTLRKAGKYV